MQNNKNPLSPHLQIYRWQISSLLSISHRIVGVINMIAITFICIWVLYWGVAVCILQHPNSPIGALAVCIRDAQHRDMRRMQRATWASGGGADP